MKKLLFGVSILLFTIVLVSTTTAGNTVLYAMTPMGGANNKGAIFSFTPATGTEAIVYSFADGADGATPTGSLVYSTMNGLFYGTTQNGGAYGSGTIFTFDPTTNTETVVWSFGNESDGEWPAADLTFDAADGLFFGQTMSGGSGAGTIFTFDPTTKAETTVYDFDGSLSGDASTDFYYDANNATLIGIGIYGQYFDGDIFSVNPSTQRITDLWDFGNGTDGSMPGIGPVAYYPGNGLLYLGMESGGANGHGAIISYDLSTNTENVAYSFAGGTDGRGSGSLVYNASKALFYAISGGGANNQGSIISFNPVNNTESVLYSFAGGTDGSSPISSPEYDATNGLYYVMTTTGGANNKGTIVSFNPANNAESVVWSFGGTNDVSSPDASFAQVISTSGINSIISNTASVTVYPNPAKDHLTIQINSMQAGEAYNATIVDVTGREIANANYAIIQNNQNIDVSALTTGVYFIEITNVHGEVTIQKFIKE